MAQDLTSLHEAGAAGATHAPLWHGSLQAILQRCESGGISPVVAIMEMLVATEDYDVVAAWLATQQHRSAAANELAQVFRAHEAGCKKIAAMLSSDVDRPPEGATVQEGVAFCRKLFDWSVAQSEEASVALYSLGSQEILQAATDEIVLVLQQWGLLDGKARALDMGCGTGRMQTALSPYLGSIVGIDVSAQMLAAARRNCNHLSNVTFSSCSGLGLEDFADGSFELVLSVDSFPYVVQSGWALVERMFAEAARVLKPSGHFVILNFSYRDDRKRDAADAAALAMGNSFHVVANGTMPFALWNADAHCFRKR